MADDRDNLEDAAGGARAMALRNRRPAGLMILFVVVVAAAAGVFGPDEHSLSASASGNDLRVEYPSETRSSIVTPVRVRLRRAGGFGEHPIEIAFSRRLFEHLDFQNWYPNPSAETADGDWVVYEFDPPDGHELAISLDARTGPNQWFSSHRYEVEVRERGRPLVSASFKMTVWP